MQQASPIFLPALLHVAHLCGCHSFRLCACVRTCVGNSDELITEVTAKFEDELGIVQVIDWVL